MLSKPTLVSEIPISWWTKKKNSLRFFHIFKIYKFQELKREKQIPYIYMYMWNLEKWLKWTYLQSRYRDKEIENKHIDTKRGKGGWDELGDWAWRIYTTMYKTENSGEPTAQHRKLYSTLCSYKEGIHVYV